MDSRDDNGIAGSEGRPRKEGAGATYPPVVALDVGTTKIACLVGELGPDGRLARVRSTATVPAQGMHKGVVVDRGEAAGSIRAAAARAAEEARARLQETFVGVAGSHIISMNRKVAIDNPNQDRRVTSAERDALLEKLKDVEVSPDFQLLHALPRDYSLDGQDGVKRPVGMWANRVEMTGHLVFGAVNAIRNLVTAVEDAGLAVDDIMLEPLASSRSCLSEQEMDSGVILVDIGGGTTDVAMFAGGRLVHSAVLPVGGNHITRDISVGVKLPLAAAEEVKISHGHAQSHLVEDIEMVRAESGLPGAEGERTQSFSRKYLARIIEARVAEIFSLVTSQARDSGFLSSIATGIVITGGTSQLEGIAGLARIVTRMPAREATPRGPSGAVDIPSNPVYATAVGLLLHGSEQMSERGPVHMPEPSTSTTGLWNEVLAKVKGWFKP